MRALVSLAYVSALAFPLALCLGCAPKTDGAKADAEAAHDDHDHEGHEHGDADHDHHHAETYAEAVAELQELRDTLRDSLKAGERDKGDVAVHEIGHVLDQLPKLAEAAGLSAEQQDEVNKEVENLFGHFDEIDKAFHGEKDQEVPYEEHAEEIDAAIERLHGLVPDADPASTDAKNDE